MSPGERRVLTISTTLVMIYLLFPVVVVVVISFSSSKFLPFPPPGLSLQWYQALLDGDWLQSYRITFQVGILTAVSPLLPAFPQPSRWRATGSPSGGRSKPC